MSILKEEVKKIIQDGIPGIKLKESDKGLKFNKESLNKYDIGILYDLPITNDVTIKRSGTGLVVIIEY